MFGRKNQTILSSHYSKLVEQDETSGSNVGDGDDEEDFFSLKRADHDLLPDLTEHSDLSKRKIRMMKSKKALAKAGPSGTKLVFDEDGQAHQLYEFKDVNDVDVEGDGVVFLRKEIGKMQRADVDDKEVAKEKKREKKRKRKEREREEVSLMIPPSADLPYSMDGLYSSGMTTEDMQVIQFLLPQTTTATATFLLCSTSRQSLKTDERISLFPRRRDLVKGTNLPLHWRMRKNSHSSIYDGEDPGFISPHVETTGIDHLCIHLLVIQHILRGPV